MNLKEKGKSIVLNNANVEYEGSYLYIYGIVNPIEATLPWRKYSIKHIRYDLFKDEVSGGGGVKDPGISESVY